MMLAYSDLQEHEDYCGSRTEPCATCGRYIMVRDAEVHQETNCQYRVVEQKNGSDSSAADVAAGIDWIGGQHDFPFHFGGLSGHSMFNTRNDLPDRIRQMLESNQHDLPYLENVFGGMDFCGTSSGVLRPEGAFIGHRLRPFRDDPPPPYIDDNDADERDGERHVIQETQATLADHISVSSDDDDDGMSSPVLV